MEGHDLFLLNERTEQVHHLCGYVLFLKDMI